MRHKTYRRKIEAVYMISGLGVIFSFYTISPDVALVSAETMPAHVAEDKERGKHFVTKGTELSKLDDRAIFIRQYG